MAPEFIAWRTQRLSGAARYQGQRLSSAFFNSHPDRRTFARPALAYEQYREEPLLDLPLVVLARRSEAVLGKALVRQLVTRVTGRFFSQITRYQDEAFAADMFDRASAALDATPSHAAFFEDGFLTDVLCP